MFRDFLYISRACAFFLLILSLSLYSAFSSLFFTSPYCRKFDFETPFDYLIDRLSYCCLPRSSRLHVCISSSGSASILKGWCIRRKLLLFLPVQILCCLASLVRDHVNGIGETNCFQTRRALVATQYELWYVSPMPGSPCFTILGLWRCGGCQRSEGWDQVGGVHIFLTRLFSDMSQPRTWSLSMQCRWPTVTARNWVPVSYIPATDSKQIEGCVWVLARRPQSQILHLVSIGPSTRSIQTARKVLSCKPQETYGRVMQSSDAWLFFEIQWCSVILINECQWYPFLFVTLQDLISMTTCHFHSFSWSWKVGRFRQDENGGVPVDSGDA